MKQTNHFGRDRVSGALLISNPEKERELMFRRTVQDELRAMREEIDTLKSRIRDLEEEN
jgi:polyhydroxyalkanoate synthesis regulator phasin